MFGKRADQLKLRLLLVNVDAGNIRGAREALGGSESPFVLDVAMEAGAAAEKLRSKQYDCLLVDPDVLSGDSPNLGELAAMAGGEAALVVLCHKHHPRSLPDVNNLTGLTFIEAEDLRRPGLSEKVSECLEVARAVKEGQVDALVAPKDGAISLLLATGADSVYRVLVETLQEGILTINQEGVIVFTNERVGEMLRCNSDDLLGIKVLALAQDADQALIKAKIDDAIRGTLSRFETGLASPGQSPAYVLVCLIPVRDTEGGATNVCLTLTDLSEEKRLRDELQRLAITDPLTGLHNRRYLADSLEKECRRARRYGRDLSCLMIDLDDLKACNDSYGHLTGDAVLRQVAALIKDSVRETDIVARYGGDEFCVLLPETPSERAMLLAERIRSTIAAQRVVFGEKSLSSTVSIGVCAPSHKDDLQPDIIVGLADAALREAKTAAKNGVCGHLSRLPGVA